LSGTTGFPFVAAGAISHARRPTNPIGLLIALVAVAFFMEDLKLSNTPLVFSIGGLVTGASSALIAHLVVAFPHGTLRSRWERRLVAAAYGTVLGCALGHVLFTGPRSSRPDGVWNVLVIRDEPGLNELFGQLLVVAGGLPRRGRAAGVPLDRRSTPQIRLLIERDGQALADLIAGDEVWRDSHSLKTLNAAAHLVRDNQPRNSRSSWPRSKRRGRGSCR
jgi:hypothetical protein